MKRKAISIIWLLFTAAPALGDVIQDGDAAWNKGDYPTAFAKFNEAALQGDARARWQLGMMYELGLGVKQDPNAAYAWFKMSAEQGNTLGENSLGDAYAGGLGIAQDWASAVHWYELSVAQGNQWAEYSLGDVYYYGNRGVAQDYQRAIALYKLSAQQGDAEAQYSLGFMFYNGVGVATDYFSADSYYAQAANGGNAQAQVALGTAYKDGRGVPQDFQSATKYFRMAARQGNLLGLANLGESYFNGQGVDKDYKKAYTFENLAAAQLTGDLQQVMTKQRDQAAALLSPAQLAEAQSEASRCLGSNFAQCDLGDGVADTARAAPPPKMSQRQASASQASTKKSPELIATGSGFFVSGAGHVVTNAHVVSGCSRVKAAGEVLKVVTVDGQSDIALLAAPNPSPVYAKLRGGRGVRLGEAVVTVGFPLHGLLGSDPIITTGVVSSLAGLNNDRRDIQISAPIQPGNSGGPVLGADGSLVGVVVAKLDAIKVAGAIGDIPQNVNFAVGVSTLQSLLNANSVPYALVGDPSTPAKSTAQIAAEATKYTVSLECWK